MNEEQAIDAFLGACQEVGMNLAKVKASMLRMVSKVPNLDDAHAMGYRGGTVSDEERQAFEAWMCGHNWPLCAHWDGKQYIGDEESVGHVSMPAMMTRRMWAAWRDRAALASSHALNAEVTGRP